MSERQACRGSAGFWLLGCGVACLAVLAPARTRGAPLIVWNTTSSMPVGLYRLVPASALRRGDVVVAHLPPEAAALAAMRNYVPATVPVVKRVAALAGDKVCAQGARLLVNGRLRALRLLRDGLGRPLSNWQGCLTLPDTGILLLGDDPASFDGRYFGPSLASAIIGKARRL